MAECKHLIEAETCGFCRPRRPYNWGYMQQLDSGEAAGVPRLVPGAEASGTLRLGPVVDAQRHGECPGCGSHIKPGDPIHYDSELGDFACGGCAPEPEVRIDEA